MKLRGLFLLVILSIFFVGCESISLKSLQQESASVPQAQVLLFDPNQPGPATKTPFQPIAATGEAVPTKTAAPRPKATRAPLPKPTATPEAVNPLPADNGGRENILLLGSDSRNDGGFRTDVILLVSVNRSGQTVSLVSFPRDLWITIPGFGFQRINTAQEFGGFSLTADTFQYNFGFRPDHYVLTNFAGFTALVDTLGGIDVNTAQELTDSCDLPQNSGGYCAVGPGSVQMDGQTALWYVRSRYSTSDFDRTRREQEVILALFTKLISLKAVERTGEIYNLLIQNVETDLSLTQMLELVPMLPAVASAPSRIQRYAIGPSEVYDYIDPYSGAWVLIPDPNAVQNVLSQAFSR